MVDERKAKYLFEVSWEVCNKVGGIYTVVKSKAHQMVHAYKEENYFLIGPYFPKAMEEFQPQLPEENVKVVLEALKKEGITVYYGKWIVKGNPNVFLIDFSRFIENKNKIKASMWEDFKIDSWNAPYDYDEPVVWATTAGMLMEELSKVLIGDKVAHFHEWLSGPALLYLKKKKVKIGTVFTTHATMLGRTLAGNNVDIYKVVNEKIVLETINPEEEAYKYNLPAKHQLERVTAEKADVFTTVSEVTELEATHILNKKPDMLVPEGLDFSELPNLEEVSINHRLYRSKMRDFAMAYFFPYYKFDIENTFFYLISGRYEFRNKGIDVTIKALSALNEKLKKDKSKRTIVVFFFIPAGIRNINLSIVESKAIFSKIKDVVEDNMNDIRDKIVYSIAQQNMPVKSKIFDDDFIIDIKKKMMMFRKEGNPPIVTHELQDENRDIILKSFREFGLINKNTDNVKVILYPCYLSTSDGLIGMDYHSVIWGCHLGIFPSYYEPWGYTPLECAAYGVPAITSDLAGFGNFVLHNSKEEPGIFVVKRHGKTEEEVVQQLVDRLYWYSNTSKDERIKNKMMARKFASMCDWGELVRHYVTSHNLAIERVKKSYQ